MTKNKHAVALGKRTSPLKAATARANGKRGGRPRIPDFVDDGFGSTVSTWCPVCRRKSIQFERPGFARCQNENHKEQ